MQVLDDRTADYLEPELVGQPLILLATAIAVGLGAEVALHTTIISSGPSGLGIPVAAAIVVAGLIYGAERLGNRPDRVTRGLYLAAIGFAILTAVRASSPMVAINVISSLTLLGLAATLHNPDASRPAFISSFARATGNFIGATWLGGFLVVGRDLRGIEFGSTQTLRRIVSGVLLAIPLLVVFGSLFVSADQVFGDAIGRVFNVQLPDAVAPALAVTAIISWCILGLLRSIVTKPPPSPEQTNRPYLGTTEASTAMWLVNGLFAVFVAFQIYEVTASYQSADVSYAQQARSGFFQLVWVAAIVVAVVLLVDWLVAASDHRRLHRQQFVLIALTGFVLTSALLRMALYVDAYGLTRLRVFTSAFMVWVAFALIWLTRSVLADKRHRFARPVVAGLLAVSLALNIANPDGLIAAYNLEHQPRLAFVTDVTYLHESLSPDAVPAIIANIDRVGDQCAQLRVAESLTVDQSSDLRNWNLSRSRASRLISTLQRQLAGACQSE